MLPQHPPHPDPLPRFLTIKEVSERLSVNRSTVLRMCDEQLLVLKELPGSRSRPILRITVDSFERYVGSAFDGRKVVAK